jgi:hypothetical protein
MIGAFDTYPHVQSLQNEIDPTFLNVDNVPEDTNELDEVRQRFQR